MADIFDYANSFGVFILSVQFDPFLEVCASVLEDGAWQSCLSEDPDQRRLNKWSVPAARDLQANALAVVQSNGSLLFGKYIE